MAKTNADVFEDFNPATGEISDALVVRGADDQETAVQGGGTDLAQEIESLRNPSSTLYSSLALNTQADVVATMRALTNSVKLKDDEGKLYDGIISLENVIVQQVEFEDDNGKLVKAPRVMLLDADGTVYHATSTGLLSALRTFFGIAGTPDTWDGAVYQIRIKQAKSRRGFFYMTIVFA
jgi:hypothetical protein